MKGNNQNYDSDKFSDEEKDVAHELVGSRTAKFNPEFEVLNKLSEKEVEKLIEEEMEFYSKTKFANIVVDNDKKCNPKSKISNSVPTIAVKKISLNGDVKIREEEIRMSEFDNNPNFELDERKENYVQKKNISQSDNIVNNRKVKFSTTRKVISNIDNDIINEEKN